MTPAQSDAMNRIAEIAREHFESAVFIATGDVVNMPQAEADRHCNVQYIYHGGIAASIGLIELAKSNVLGRAIDVE